MTTKVSRIAYHSDDLGTTVVTRSSGSAMEDGGVCDRALSASSGTFPFFSLFLASLLFSIFSFSFSQILTILSLGGRRREMLTVV